MVLNNCVNLLPPGRCWSENYNLVWNTLTQVSKHNPTLQFWHLNLIWINTKHKLALGTFKSFPGLFWQNTNHTAYVCQSEASDPYFEIWVCWWKGRSSLWGGL